MWNWSFPINKSLWTSSYVVFAAGMATVAAVVGSSFLVTTTAANASVTEPTRDEILSCSAMIYAPGDPIFWAEWNLRATPVDKTNILENISKTRVLLNAIRCVGPLQPDPRSVEVVNKGLDSAEASVKKNEFKTAETTLHVTNYTLGSMENAILEWLY